MSSKTKIANVKYAALDAQHVYIGRPSIFGNPYPLHAEEERAAVLQRFRDYAERRMKADQKWAAEVRALRGKTLLCFCSPKACHGDVLAELADRD